MHDRALSADDAAIMSTVNERVTQTRAQHFDAAHMYTFKPNALVGNARYWLPCVDAADELCLWRIEVTVDERLVVVASGELTVSYKPSANRCDCCVALPQDATRCDDEPGSVTYHHQLAVPTSAAHIGLAVGPFDIHPVPSMQNVC